MTAPAAPLPFLARGDFLELVDDGCGIGVVWVSVCACGRRRLLCIADNYPDARDQAAEWSGALGGLAILDRLALN